MNISGVHLLLTYQCNLECDHCFAWGSPWQTGTITLKGIREILRQACELGTVEWFYFEGGEPFLFYPIMVRGVEEAARLGFKVGIVTNGYWGTDRADALEWLQPFKNLVQDLSVSSDVLHWSVALSRQAKNVKQAAAELGIPLGIISIAPPETANALSAVGKLPPSESGIMYRGRAAGRRWWSSTGSITRTATPTHATCATRRAWRSATASRRSSRPTRCTASRADD